MLSVNSAHSPTGFPVGTPNILEQEIDSHLLRSTNPCQSCRYILYCNSMHVNLFMGLCRIDPGEYIILSKEQSDCYLNLRHLRIGCSPGCLLYTYATCVYFVALRIFAVHIMLSLCVVASRSEGSYSAESHTRRQLLSSRASSDVVLRRHANGRPPQRRFCRRQPFIERWSSRFVSPESS